MSSEEQDMEKSGRKRKHQDESETGASPAKKAKSRSRNEKRLKRMSAKAEHKKESLALVESSPKLELKKKKSRKHRSRREEAEAPDEALRTAETAPAEDVVKDDAVDMEKVKRKQEKKARREAARAEKSAALVPSTQTEDGKKRNTKTERQAMALPSRPGGRWKISERSGGRFIRQDPLFVRDAGGEEYIIAAMGHELQVLSLKSSLLVRSLSTRKDITILAFAIESPRSSLVYVADDKGSIRSWDWTNDLPARTVESFTGSVRAVAATRLDESDGNIVFPHITWVGGLYFVKVQNAEYRTKRRLNSIQLLEGPECILAQGPDVLVVGFSQGKEGYNWVELPLSKRATCMNARMLDQPGVSKKGSRTLQVQLAIGYDDGQIHIYHDIAALSQGRKELPEPRVLHWHRAAVSSIKFSPDGNYLISGGTETVLVLWQLETGRKQYVPHLTSEIERITINAPGDRYALQMGDNSIMVLSTAELKPVANFAGLQLQTVGSEGSTAPAAMLNPGNPKQLLLTVPPTLPANAQEPAPRPFLQTFDLGEARHVMRQALTRNNATDLNTGPEHNAILPPDVAHLAVSQDGQWLATVDEWMPPAADVHHLATNRAEAEEARRSRREVYLKVWHWDQQQEIWTLSTRADAPHQRAGAQSMGAGRIVALVADPVSNAFATVGEDGCVKIWKPKTRMRGGVAMKDAQDADLIEWTCRRSIQLPTANDHADSPVGGAYPSELTAAVAAYSSDGSLLAVSSSTPTVVDESVPAVTFIDTASGAIRSVDAGLSDGTPMTAVAFVERHFVAVTHRAAFVWDLVTHTLVQKIKLPHAGDARSLLAVSEADQTFALVSPAPPAKGMKVRVAVYTTRDAKKVWKQDFGTEVVQVLAGKGSRGYTLLFADATVRTVSPAGGVMASRLRSAASGTEVPTLPPASEATDVDGPQTAGLLTSSAATAGAPAFEVDEDDRPVVRPEQLASIFDVGQSFAMPPIKDMFHAVVGLFGRKPQPRVAVV